MTPDSSRPAATAPPAASAPVAGSHLRAVRSRLVAHVGFNGLAQVAPMLATLAITPLLLHRLGLDRYGIWALALVILNTLTALDGGISASLARFFAIYAARAERGDTARLLLGALVLFMGGGLALTLIALPVAPAVIGLLNVPGRLEGQGIAVLRWLPALAMLALMADSGAALLQGTERFRSLAVAMFASSATFVLAVAVVVQPGVGLETLVAASGLRYLTLLVVSLACARRDLEIRRPLLPARATRREVRRYASRMQLSAATGFVNGELDALVVAAVLPVRYVGLYGVGLQAASAARSLPLYAFAPLLTRLTMTFRSEGRDAAVAEFARLERRWLRGVLAYGLVAVSAIGFSVPLWLGHRYALSGATAAVLLAGFTAHVGLTGMRTCYVRAVGRPGLETRYSLVGALGNALLTIPLALAVGVVGVVSATAVSALVASLYFVVICRRLERLPVVVPPARWWGLAAVAAAVTVLGELAMVRTQLHGFLGLALSGAPAALALLVFVPELRRSRD